MILGMIYLKSYIFLESIADNDKSIVGFDDIKLLYVLKKSLLIYGPIIRSSENSCATMFHLLIIIDCLWFKVLRKIVHEFHANEII